MIDLRRMLGPWRRLDVAVRDLPLGLALFAASLVPQFHSHGTRLGGMPGHAFDALALLAVAAQSLPLAVRRRWPTACLAVVSLGFAVDQLRGYHTVAGTGLAFAVMSAGACLEWRRRWVAAVSSVGYGALAAVLYRFGHGESIGEFVMFYLALVLVWGIGSWWRSTRAADAERRRRVAADTRAAERARIARELHDVVTHHVTAMVVQAEAARYLTASPDRLDATLNNVTDTGRRAITDLRHLLDLLNPDHGDDVRAPSAGDLAALVEQTRRAGQPVEFTQDGAPAPDLGSADLVAHRVVRESLTNALKYAHGSPTRVSVRHGDREISVEVATADSGAPPGGVGGSGRGLAGLRERVDVLGGEFEAGPRDGGFLVRARIPAARTP